MHMLGRPDLATAALLVRGAAAGYAEGWRETNPIGRVGSATAYCEAHPWCKAWPPKSKRTPHAFGRTAICLTGGARSLYAETRNMVLNTGGGSGSIMGQHWFVNTRWAGPVRKRYPHNLIATSLQNNLFDPLAFGGFDLFVVRRGPLCAYGPNHTLAPTSEPSASNGGYDALRPDSVNWQGVPNRMIVHQKGEEHSLPYNASSPLWRNYLYTYKVRHAAEGYHRKAWQQAVYIQAVLHLMHDQHLCNEMVRNHSQRMNLTYAYKVRLRPDMAFLAPLPPLHTLDFGAPGAEHVLVTTATVFAGGNQDSFAIGRARVMDVYLSRYLELHAYKAVSRWTTEGFLMDHLWLSVNATIKEHPEIQGAIVRLRNFTRGKPGTSELVAWKYEMDNRINGAYRNASVLL